MELKRRYDIVAVVGPTATGKTRRAVSLAKALGGEIISGDSRQVYRKMDLGTGKDLFEYDDTPYHLIDICEPGEKYNLHRFLKDFSVVCNDLRRREVMPVLCGGTGMYVETALSGISLPDVPCNEDLRSELKGKPLTQLVEILKSFKVLHNVTDVDTVKRAVRAIEIEQYYLDHPAQATLADRSLAKPLDSLIIGIDIPREIRRERISQRLDSRLMAGMTEEVKSIIDSGVDPQDLIYYGLEYKFVTLHVIGQMTFDEMKRQLEIAIHQFAKRQMTWFRGMERRGFKINWLPYDLPESDFLDAVAQL